MALLGSVVLAGVDSGTRTYWSSLTCTYAIQVGWLMMQICRGIIRICHSCRVCAGFMLQASCGNQCSYCNLFRVDSILSLHAGM